MICRALLAQPADTRNCRKPSRIKVPVAVRKNASLPQLEGQRASPRIVRPSDQSCNRAPLGLGLLVKHRQDTIRKGHRSAATQILCFLLYDKPGVYANRYL